MKSRDEVGGQVGNENWHPPLAVTFIPSKQLSSQKTISTNPKLSDDQGCQIFLSTTYQNG
jgi:hypothetical protein